MTVCLFDGVTVNEPVLKKELSLDVLIACGFKAVKCHQRATSAATYTEISFVLLL